MVQKIEYNNGTKTNAKAKQYYCDNEKHGKLYDQMKELFSEFTSRKRLEECHHKYDTQLNEGLNTTVAM
eukprot:13490403-Ditylum_brightwellii.AAC.2